MDPQWLTAIATTIYTIGTLALWWTTTKTLKAMRESLDLTRDAFKLNFLIAVQEADELRRNRTVGSAFLNRDLLQRVFPEVFDSLITRKSE
jgi:hypothetical protein